MATIVVSGTVAAKEGTDPVKLITFDNGNQIASFSVLDRQYVYRKPGEEAEKQFYTVEVVGKAASIVVDRLERGHKVTASGQLVPREYNGKTYLTVKNAQVTFLEHDPEKAAAAGRGQPSDEEVPF